MAEKPHRPRLLVVSPYYASHGGGVEIVAEHVASGLANEGFEVAWAASDCDEPPAPSGVECIPMPSTNAIERRAGVPLPLWTPAALRKLWNAVRSADAVMVHESLYLPSLAACAFARACRKPLLLVQHVGEVPYRNPALRALVRAGNVVAAGLAHAWASRVVFISAVVRDYFGAGHGRLGDKWRLIPNGLATELFRGLAGQDRATGRSNLGLAADRPVVLFVGRFVEKKGLALIRQLASQRPHWQWVFVGSGPIDPAGWNFAHVRVVGRVAQAQLPAWYRAADLLVLPSVGEGFPLVVQEAMACGLPVAGPTETAHALPGVAGHAYFANPGEDAEATERWLHLLDEALGAPVESKRLAVAQFAHEHWSWQRCVHAYRDVLNEMLRR